MCRIVGSPDANGGNRSPSRTSVRFTARPQSFARKLKPLPATPVFLTGWLAQIPRRRLLHNPRTERIPHPSFATPPHPPRYSSPARPKHRHPPHVPRYFLPPPSAPSLPPARNPTPAVAAPSPTPKPSAHPSPRPATRSPHYVPTSPCSFPVPIRTLTTSTASRHARPPSPPATPTSASHASAPFPASSSPRKPAP